MIHQFYRFSLSDQLVFHMIAAPLCKEAFRYKNEAQIIQWESQNEGKTNPEQLLTR